MQKNSEKRNYVKSFLKECAAKRTTAEPRMTVAAVAKIYKKWARANGAETLTTRGLGKFVPCARFPRTVTRFQGDKKSVRVFENHTFSY